MLKELDSVFLDLLTKILKLRIKGVYELERALHSTQHKSIRDI